MVAHGLKKSIVPNSSARNRIGRAAGDQNVSS
jgi:hypothetical protein